MQSGGDDFDLAGGQLGIWFLALHHFAFDRDYVFAADVLGFAVRFGLRFFVENDWPPAIKQSRVCRKSQPSYIMPRARASVRDSEKGEEVGSALGRPKIAPGVAFDETLAALSSGGHDENGPKAPACRLSFERR